MSSRGADAGCGENLVVVDGEAVQRVTKVKEGGGARAGSETKLTTAAMSLSCG